LLCYYFSSVDSSASPGTWADALSACAAADATLASVPDVPAFYAASVVVRETGEDVWVGLLNFGGDYTWLDETLFDDSLTQFISNETDDRYGYINATDGLFHLGDGSTALSYLCYVDLRPPAPAPTTVTTTTPAASTTSAPCAAPWTELQGDSSYCYLVSSDHEAWPAAGHDCDNQGGSLVTLNEENLLPLLLSLAGGEVYWTGLEDNNGTYVWQDGSDATDVETLVVPYMDDWSEEKYCVSMKVDGFPEIFVHQDYFDQNRYVCYKPVNN